MWNHKLHTLRRQKLFENDERSGAPRSQAQQAARALATALILEGPAFTRWDEVRQLLSEPGSSTWSITAEQISCAIEQDRALPSLPPTYGFKGGAARHMLRRALGHPGEAPRDIDLIRLGRRWTQLDTELSGMHMADDFRRGHGVELISDLAHYFRSRDISVNELIHADGLLRATPLAVLDNVGMVLRPCRYLPGTLAKPPALLGRTLLKMLRLRAEGLMRGESWTLSGIPERIDIEEFHVALQLHRSFERSEETARIFVDSLVLLGLFEPEGDSDTLQQVRESLAHHLEQLDGSAT